MPVGTVRNIKIADFTSTGAGPIASSITGLDSKHLLQNVTLENIKTESLFPATESVRDIDDTQFVKIKKGYPNSHRLGELPAYGLYARFVDGLTLKNVSMKLSCKEPRPPAAIVDCKNVVVDNFKADSDNKSAPTITFERTENVQEQSAATNRHSS